MVENKWLCQDPGPAYQYQECRERGQIFASLNQQITGPSQTEARNRKYPEVASRQFLELRTGIKP